MTILQLKNAIADLPDDMPVIIQKDAEGNGYSPCVGASGEDAFYIPDGSYSGTVYNAEDIKEFDDDEGIQVCVLWPNR